MKYELTLMVKEETTTKEIKELVKSMSGTLEQEESWGKKTLAYPIKKDRSAFYYYWILNMTPSHIVEFRKKLNFNENIMRYLLLIAE